MDKVQWNHKIKLIVSDVDETIADLFLPAKKEMIDELHLLLEDEKSIFLVSGAGLQSIKTRVIDFFEPKLRKRFLVSHCSGAEVLGFDGEGNVLPKPFFSLYDTMLTEEQK